MLPTPRSELSIEAVKAELQKLRQGPGLAHPANVMQLSDGLRAHLLDGQLDGDIASEIAAVVAALRTAIDQLGEHERRHALADFNIGRHHGHPTLTGRQESLATELGCTAKTVRRHAEQALQTLALLVINRSIAVPARSHLSLPTEADTWQQQLKRFWKVTDGARVDIVCSEVPTDERPYYASPEDRNYLRYAKFADLDSLIYARTRLAQINPDMHVRDFAPSEYYANDAEVMIVIGGPPWNAKYREFLPQLPFHFQPNSLGEDDPLVVPHLKLTLGPRWTARNELLEDLAVFTRLRVANDASAYLLGGCLTLGVLGAVKCFLQGERGAANAEYINKVVADADFVLVTEARRIGGITDVADMAAVPPLLLLARDNNAPFQTVLQNTARYSAV